jgi:NTP pyrophosphatase (non-canonical NTP hydrolase)
MGQSGWATTEIMRERARQDSKWGVQNHSVMEWHLILAEEFGEVGKALNEYHFRKAPLKDVRDEVIQTAAVCIAMLESMDRNQGDQL